jgi:epoxide hydrolase-like predicted phosphatase
MSIRAVIFDMGGVLVRTENRAPRTRLAARLGLTYDELSALVFDSKSAHQAMKGEITTAEHWEAVRKTLGVSKKEFPQVPLEFWGGDALDEDLINFLRGLRLHYKTAMLSNAWDDLRQMIEEIWMIDDAFDQILISAEVGLVKPDRLIYEKIISDLGVKPAEAVFVDDFPHNVEAAKGAGLEAIHFLGPDQVLEDLRKLLDEK